MEYVFVARIASHRMLYISQMIFFYEVVIFLGDFGVDACGGLLYIKVKPKRLLCCGRRNVFQDNVVCYGC